MVQSEGGEIDEEGVRGKEMEGEKKEERKRGD